VGSAPATAGDFIRQAPQRQLARKKGEAPMGGQETKIIITIEMRPSDPSEVEGLVSQINRYEVPVLWTGEPVIFQLLQGEREVLHSMALKD
jgi:hypothetical protein